MARKKGRLHSGTWVERELFTSRAFWALRGAAPQLLIMFLGKRDIRKIDHYCRNLRKLTMTYIELEKLFKKNRLNQNEADGIERKRIIRAIDELLAKGFLEIVHRGGAYQQDKSMYALVDDWCLWRKGTIYRTREPESRVRGYINKNKTNG